MSGSERVNRISIEHGQGDYISENPQLPPLTDFKIRKATTYQTRKASFTSPSNFSTKQKSNPEKFQQKLFEKFRLGRFSCARTYPHLSWRAIRASISPCRDRTWLSRSDKKHPYLTSTTTTSWNVLLQIKYSTEEVEYFYTSTSTYFKRVLVEVLIQGKYFFE